MTFAVTAGGGSLTGAVQTTDAQGEAEVGSWVLGAGAPNELTAAIPLGGIDGNPVKFRAQSASKIALAELPRSVKKNETFTVSAQIADADGASVGLAGVPLTLEVSSEKGSFSAVATLLTDGRGQVEFTGVKLAGKDGKRLVRVSGDGLSAATVEIELKK